MPLEDAGKRVTISRKMYVSNFERYYDRDIVMVIVAPRGECRLFSNVHNPSMSVHSQVTDTQCEAIRAFMEEYKDDS